jgi:hypothetical protein
VFHQRTTKYLRARSGSRFFACERRIVESAYEL